MIGTAVRRSIAGFSPEVTGGGGSARCVGRAPARGVAAAASTCFRLGGAAPTRSSKHRSSSVSALGDAGRVGERSDGRQRNGGMSRVQSAQHGYVCNTSPILLAASAICLVCTRRAVDPRGVFSLTAQTLSRCRRPEPHEQRESRLAWRHRSGGRGQVQRGVGMAGKPGGPRRRARWPRRGVPRQHRAVDRRSPREQGERAGGARQQASWAKGWREGVSGTPRPGRLGPAGSRGVACKAEARGKGDGWGRQRAARQTRRKCRREHRPRCTSARGGAACRRGKAA